MAGIKHALHLSQRRLARLRRVAFGGAIVIGGLLWAYSMAHTAGLQVSADGIGLDRVIALVHGS
jgi:hypothetical protein